MGQQISSSDDARTQVVPVENIHTQHSRSVSLEPLPPPQHTDLPPPDNLDSSQMHTVDNPLTERSSKQLQTFHHDIKRLAAPLRPNLVLENKGNVARDHLASERTYLAYVRTSLACASAGVALVQLFTLSSPTDANVMNQGGIDLQHFARPLGATMVLFGLFILILGVVRYFMTQAALVRGFFPVAHHSLTVVALILGTLVIIIFSVLVAGAKG